MTPTIICPHCGQLHALYWEKNLVGRNLKYLCNRYPKLRKTPDGKIECRRSTTAIYIYDPKPYLEMDIPERWSKKLVKRMQRERECDLPLNLEPTKKIRRRKMSVGPES